MSFARVSGFDVIAARIDMPQRGAWTAVVELDTGDAAPPTGNVSIDFDTDTPISFVGAAVDVASSNPAPGRARIVIHAGVNGMGSAVLGKPYADVSPRLVVEDIVAAGGEALGAVAALDGLTTRLLWLRPAGTAGAALARFLAPAGLLWRMTIAGLVDIVSETWPAYAGRALLERDPDEHGRCLLALDMPDLYPGMSLFDKHVTRVVHCVRRDGTIRTEAVLQ